ncbi:conserved hypothetical protein [Ricinus communis]|uniref:Uncharacterized protein n=1 Tax=Ricinus communis TaxID=3988 RepID=B9RQ02_RICCO|nr:conserved hypothetical protein [Ricinus communis]
MMRALVQEWSCIEHCKINIHKASKENKALLIENYIRAFKLKEINQVLKTIA